MEQVARTPATVLITGKTGTGKELVAAAIHDASPRRDRVMVRVSCAALPATLIESKRFGREKGVPRLPVARMLVRADVSRGRVGLVWTATFGTY